MNELSGQKDGGRQELGEAKGMTTAGNRGNEAQSGVLKQKPGKGNMLGLGEG